MLTPEELQQIRRLHVQLGRRVDSPFAGEYRSAFRGRGMEFEEVRPYFPGDDVRHIDWNVTARANAPFIKEFREERELTLMLVVDISPSMLLGIQGPVQLIRLSFLGLVGITEGVARVKIGKVDKMLHFCNWLLRKDALNPAALSSTQTL